MIPVLSCAQMRAFDARATSTCKVLSLVLMENAGRGAADVFEREIFAGSVQDKRVTVMCGTGNNGGDGFVVGRHLLLRGAKVKAWLLGSPAKLTADCRANHDAFVGVGGKVDAAFLTNLDVVAASLAKSDALVDALFGTGLDRPITDVAARVVSLMNEATAPTLALDVPSGMNADTGVALGPAVRATCTVTFAHRKLGHVTGQGAHFAGAVHVVDIGVPSALHTEPAAWVAEAFDLRALLVPRPLDAHKYRVGHVAVFAGSRGKPGAAVLAAHGAMRAGAGAVTLATWPDVASALETRIAEVMVARLVDDAEGVGALARAIDSILSNKRAVVVGPGFGTDARARVAVSHILAHYPGPMVVDADALTLHAGALADFNVASGRVVLTPHAGELARLLDTTSEQVESDRFTAAREAAARAQCVVLLKGPFSVIAGPDGKVVVNPTGNPALATAGSGDTLAGITAAFLTFLPPFEAAWCAAYVHGAAADVWSSEFGDRGLLAHEIADYVPRALRALVTL